METKAPTATLETKWGTVEVTFNNPDKLTGEFEWIDEWVRTETKSGVLCYVRGFLTINRVEVEVSQSFEYRNTWVRIDDKTGKREDLPKPVKEFRPVWNASYNRRADGSFKDLPTGVQSVLWNDLAAVVEEFYLSRPDLQKEAVRYDLLQEVERADKALADAEAEVRGAAARVADAAARLYDFDNA